MGARLSAVENASSAELEETALDDLEWLAITDDRLFDDLFIDARVLAIEKSAEYDVFVDHFRDIINTIGLGGQDKSQSRTPPLFSRGGRASRGPRYLRQTTAGAKHHRQLLEDKMIGVVEFDDIMLGALTTKVMASLCHYTTKPSLYAETLRKRLLVMYRITLAMARQRQREKYRASSASKLAATTTSLATTESLVSNGSPLVQMNVQLFGSLVHILQQTDPKYIHEMLGALLAILSKLPPLSLRREPRQMLDALRSFLVSFLEAAYRESTAATSQQHRHREISTQAATSLVILSIARGSLTYLLWTVHCLLYFAELLDPLPLGEYLSRQWADRGKDAPPGGLFTEKQFLGTWTFHWAESEASRKAPLNSVLGMKIAGAAVGGFGRTAAAVVATGGIGSAGRPGMGPAGEGLPEHERHDEIFSGPEPADPRGRVNQPLTITVQKIAHAGIATDGTYLYILDNKGLVKVGTGRGGTIQGHTYAAVKEFRGGKERGWLAYAAGKLFYRAPEIAPAVLLVIDKDTLTEEARLMPSDCIVDSREDDVSTASSGFFAEAGGNAKGGGARSPLISDGHVLYIVEERVEGQEHFSATSDSSQGTPRDDTTPSESPLKSMSASDSTTSDEPSEIERPEEVDKQREEVEKGVEEEEEEEEEEEVEAGPSSPKAPSSDLSHSTAPPKPATERNDSPPSLPPQRPRYLLHCFEPVLTLSTAPAVRHVRTVELTAQSVQSGSASPRVLSEFVWAQARVSYVTLKNSNIARFGCQAVLVGKKVFVIGGAGDYIYNPLVDIVDTEHMTWTQPGTTGSYLSNFDGHVCCRAGKRIVVFGGKQEHAPINSIFVLDTEKIAWSSPGVLPGAPAARFGHCADVINGMMYVFAGRCARSTPPVEDRLFNDMYAVNLDELKTWVPVRYAGGTVPTPRTRASMTAVRGKLFVFGGWDGSRFCNDLYVFDPTNGVWTQPPTSGTPPPGRAAHSATLIGSKLFIFGGRVGLKERSNELYYLDVDTMEWTAPFVAGNRPMPRAAHAAVAVGSKLIVLCGRSARGSEKDVYVLETDTASVMTRQCLAAASFFATKAAVGALVPPGLFPNPSAVAHLLMLFDPAAGSLKASAEVRHAGAAGSATAYDSVNGNLWNYAADAHKVSLWRDAGESAETSENFLELSTASSTLTLSPTDAALLILAKLDGMARKYFSEIHARDTRPSSVTDESLCVEISSEAFKWLLTLLETAAVRCGVAATPCDSVKSVHDGRWTAVVHALLRILKANLSRLVNAPAESRAAVLFAGGDSDLVAPFRALLCKLVRHGNAHISLAACELLTYALDVFYPSPSLKRTLLIDLFVETANSTAMSTVSTHTVRLLDALLDHLAASAAVSTLVVPVPSSRCGGDANSANSGDVGQEEEQGRKFLLDLVATVAEEAASDLAVALRGTAAHHVATTSTGGRVLRLLQMLQRDLLSRASQTIATSTSSSATSLFAAPQPRQGSTRLADADNHSVLRTLESYALQVLARARQYVCDLTTRLTNSAAGVGLGLSPSVDKAVRGSFFGRLVPALATALYALPFRLATSQKLLPLVTELVQAVDRLSSQLPDVDASEAVFRRVQMQWLAAVEISPASDDQHSAVAGRPRAASLNGVSTASRTTRPSGAVRIHWLLDLEKTLGHVGGRLVRDLIRGEPPSAKDSDYRRPLESRLLIRGMEPRFFEAIRRAVDPLGSDAAPEALNAAIAGVAVDMLPEDVFLQDWIAARGDARLAIDALRAHIAERDPGPPRRGGDSVSTTADDESDDAAILTAERAVCAALIKHKRLVGDVMAFAEAVKSARAETTVTPPQVVPPTGLVHIWQVTRKEVGRWLQRNKVLDVDAKPVGNVTTVESMSTPPQPQAASPVGASVAKFQRLVEEVINKANFLLKFVPADDSRGLHADSPNTARLVRFRSAERIRRSSGLSYSSESTTATHAVSVVRPLRVSADTVSTTTTHPQPSGPPPPSRDVAAFLETLRTRMPADQLAVDGGAAVLAAAARQIGGGAVSNPAGVDEVDSAVVRFVHQQELPVGPLYSILVARQRRAESRVQGFEAALALLRGIDFASVKQDVLRGAVQGLHGNHYLADAAPCGNDMRLRLQLAFTTLWRLYAWILKDAAAPVSMSTSAGHVRATDPLLKLLLLDAWAVEFTENDHEFLHGVGIFSILRRLMSLTRYGVAHVDSATAALNDEADEQRRAAWQAFRYLAITVGRKALAQSTNHKPAASPVDSESATSMVSSSSSLNELHKSILELLFGEIEGLVDLMQQQSPMSTPSLAGSPIERYCYDVLLLITSLSASDISRKFLGTRRFTALLLALLPLATPRIQRTVLRLCRRVLPLQPPERLTGLVKKGKSVIQSLFELVGVAHWPVMRIGNVATIDEGDEHVETWRSGQVAMATAAECIMLLRSLMDNPLWRPALIKAITAALVDIPDLLRMALSDPIATNNSEQFSERVHAAIAAVNVIGGHIDGIRVGGRVDLVDGARKKEGTVVSVDRVKNRALVLVDTTNPEDARRPKMFGLEKLTPLTEVPFDPTAFPLTADLLATFECFLGDGVAMTTRLMLVLKPRALKALALMCGDQVSVATFLIGKRLPALLARSHASAFREFVSLDKLEERALRLAERAYEAAHGPRRVPASELSTSTASRSVNRVSSTETLPGSPFRELPFRLPTRMVSEGGQVHVDEDDECTLTCLQRTSGSSSSGGEVCVVRSDVPIADALPAFYFEVRIVEEGRRAYNAAVGIGLYPCAEKLYGMPGFYNGSYGYVGQYGYKYSWKDAGSGHAYGPAFGRGDVVGCGWTKWDGKVFFTKNGTHLGTAFRHVAGRFYAVLGMSEFGSRVTVNFGQEPFRYDFSRKLIEALSASPTAPLTSLQKNADITEEGEEHEPMATVSKQGNDTAPPRVHTLSSGQYGPLPRADGLPAPSPSTADIVADLSDSDLDLSDSDGEDGGSGWSHGHFRGNANGEYASGDDNSSSESEDNGSDSDSSSGDDVSTLTASQRLVATIPPPPQRTLGAGSRPQPPGSRGRVHAVSTSSTLLKQREGTGSIDIDKVKEGMWLTVRPDAESTQQHGPKHHRTPSTKGKEHVVNDSAVKAEHEQWSPQKRRTLGRTGQVRRVDMSTRRIQLEFYNVDTAIRATFWYSAGSLAKPKRAVAAIVSVDTAHRRASAESFAADLSTESTPLDRALYSELQYIEAYLSAVYARSAVLSLLSNWPAEAAFDLPLLGGYHGLLDVLDLAAAECLGGSQSTAVNSTRMRSASYAVATRTAAAHTRYSMDRLQRKLRALIRDSGGSGLGDQLCQETLRHFAESAKLGTDRASGFVVTSDGRLTLAATPAAAAAVRRKPNVHLGCWLLDLLLEEIPDHIRTQYYAALFDAMLEYVTERSTPKKAKLFPRLVRLLHTFRGFPEGRDGADRRTADRLQFLEKHLTRQYDKETANGGTLLQCLSLQRLCEFMIAVRKWRTPIDRAVPAHDPASTSDDTDLESVDKVDVGTDPNARGWFDRVVDISELMAAFLDRRPLPSAKAPSSENAAEHVSGGRLPLPFVARLWIDLQTPFILHESRHPYLESGPAARITGEVHIPNAAKLVVVFDRQSRVDSAACLYFSKLADGGEILHRFTGAFGSSEPHGSGSDNWSTTGRGSSAGTTPQPTATVVEIDGDKFYFQFHPTLLGLGVIHDFYCYGCNEYPIHDVVYKCANCDYYVCERCEEVTPHDRRHIFLKIRRTLPSDHPRYNYLPILYAPGEIPGVAGDIAIPPAAAARLGISPNTASAAAAVANTEHNGICCSWCGTAPIIGVRYKCVNCEDFNLCEPCEAAAADAVDGGHAVHDRDHVFLRIKYPLPIGDDAPSFEPIPSFYPESNYWGFRFTVHARFSEKYKRVVADRHRVDIVEAARAQRRWPLAADLQLTQYVNRLTDEKGKSALSLTVDDLGRPPEALFPLLGEMPPNDLKLRFAALQRLNERLAANLCLIDLSMSTAEWSLGHRLCMLRPLLFAQTKLAVWNEAISKTGWTGSVPSIRLDRRKAAEEREALTGGMAAAPSGAGSDGSGKGSGKSVHDMPQHALVVQAFRQLRDFDATQLRSNHQSWNVAFEGESGIDIGGVFRDSLAEFCSELTGPLVALFVRCPNAQDGQGRNRDKYIPNPARSSPADLALFEFVGKLMGVALRTRELLPLDLPSIVWKPLVGLPVTRTDLEDIDVLSCRGIDILRNDEFLRKEGITEDNFHEVICYVWTTNSSDGREVELIPDGKNSAVRWSEKAAYAQAIEEYKLHEVDAQVAAMRRGLDSIVPTSLLSLFTWQELELQVCGRPDVDIELLRRNTKYNGCTAASREVKMLFEVLRTFSQEERSLFLRFVWGRSRLPVTQDFPVKFTIRLLKNESAAGLGPSAVGAAKNADAYLPSAHTCFFSLDLPAYSSQEIMREKLLKAITMCTSVEIA